MLSGALWALLRAKWWEECWRDKNQSTNAKTPANGQWFRRPCLHLGTPSHKELSPDAASKAGLGERTSRILDPEFQRQVTELRADMVQRALGKQADAATEALDTPRGLLAGEAEA
jgi:hypothetical protein